VFFAKGEDARLTRRLFGGHRHPEQGITPYSRIVNFCPLPRMQYGFINHFHPVFMMDFHSVRKI